MALSEEYIRKIDFLENNLTKRMYEKMQAVQFRAFFTYDRRLMRQNRRRQSLCQMVQNGAKNGNTAGSLQMSTCRCATEKYYLWQTWVNALCL